jgi:hypothetical protein
MFDPLKHCHACKGNKYIWDGSMSNQEPCYECNGTGDASPEMQQDATHLRDDARKVYTLIRDNPGMHERELMSKCSNMGGSRLQRAVNTLLDYSYVTMKYSNQNGRNFYLAASAPDANQLFAQSHTILTEMRMLTVRKMLEGEPPYAKVAPEDFREYSAAAKNIAAVLAGGEA